MVELLAGEVPDDPFFVTASIDDGVVGVYPHAMEHRFHIGGKGLTVSILVFQDISGWITFQAPYINGNIDIIGYCPEGNGKVFLWCLFYPPPLLPFF